MVFWNTNGRNSAAHLEMIDTKNTQEIEPVKPTVPWTGFDVLLVFVLWILALNIGWAVVCYTCVDPALQKVYVGKEAGKTTPHPIVQLVQEGENALAVLLVAFLVAVVVAPIIEEFLFRMLFQGWLESKLKQSQIPYASGIAIVAVSLCFAAIHWDNGSRFLEPMLLFYTMATSIVVNLLVFLLGLIYLNRVRNIKVTNYLFGTDRFFRSRFFVRTGDCLLMVLLCLGLNFVLTWAYPGTNVSPIPIFFFALALGVLYSRTQNLVYCILLHACLNGISLALVWYMSATL